ncbi:MAG: ABC transporter permease subunit [Gammaproteobacteria bacterium]|nr:MAG: ABC transporter permease subunit [Gammaproteobacteria bacterium]
MFNSPAMKRTRLIRAWKDRLARQGIVIGGLFVIVAVMLIFFYLLWEVAPLFRNAHMETVYQQAQASDSPDTLYLAVEEQRDIGFRLTADGQASFVGVRDGRLVSQHTLPHAAPLTVVARADAISDLVALGYDDGQVLLLKQQYKVVYPDDVKTVLPSLEYPYGETPIAMGDGAIQQLGLRNNSDSLALVAAFADGHLAVKTFSKRTNFMTGATTLRAGDSLSWPGNGQVPQGIWVDADSRFVFVVYDDGLIHAYDMDTPAALPQERRLPAGRKVTASSLLLGGISLLVGDSRGVISQWFMVRDADNRYRLTPVRELKLDDAAIVTIRPEQRRKGFVATDASGHVGLFNATAERLAYKAQLDTAGIRQLAISPRADGLFWETVDGRLSFAEVHNEHGDISWSALWGKVWYENYDSPQYIWQSSASNNDFEPKYSLMPLSFGTLKAAFYAMLLATPLAICGAIFTAYFMAPRLRTMIKPTIELMEALPTVILGFLAGLWLAPLVESTLPGIVSVLLVTPVCILGAAYLWSLLPRRIRHAVPEGWEPILLMPVIVFAVWVPMSLSGWMEVTFFGGDVRLWLDHEMGIPFDQRNALVVGLAMGFAVIPTIFSIAEDALFAVPKHLTNGSLALGATPWQTLTRVVLPTASPGIFSAVMIGFGRAVGETMIVLMATGNTPVMSANIFEGLRTLSANIAVELAESEVASTHFRILFLAALVLFLFTFVFNTTAELVRHRLRRKYGSL